jgi:hypothetical protein
MPKFSRREVLQSGAFLTAEGKHLVFLDQLARIDLLKYKEWAQKTGRSERTAGNKMGRVNQFHRTKTWEERTITLPSRLAGLLPSRVLNEC